MTILYLLSPHISHTHSLLHSQLMTLLNTHQRKTIENRITMGASNSTSVYISKRIESKVSKGYLHTHVHSSIIHNSQNVETNVHQQMNG